MNNLSDKKYYLATRRKSLIAELDLNNNLKNIVKNLNHMKTGELLDRRM